MAAHVAAKHMPPSTDAAVGSRPAAGRGIVRAGMKRVAPEHTHTHADTHTHTDTHTDTATGGHDARAHGGDHAHGDAPGSRKKPAVAAAAATTSVSSNWAALKARMHTHTHARTHTHTQARSHARSHTHARHSPEVRAPTAPSASVAAAFIATKSPVVVSATPAATPLGATGPSLLAAAESFARARTHTHTHFHALAQPVSGGTDAAGAPAAAAQAGAARPRSRPGAKAAPSADPVVKQSILEPYKQPGTAAHLVGDAARFLALDCEMVGVGRDGVRSALARVVVTDWIGRVLYDRFVRPQEAVTDYRTHVSGITPADLRPEKSVDFPTAQREIAALIRDKVLVGHGLVNDLKCLMLSHPFRDIRDTARWRPLCRPTRSGHLKPRRLKHLTAEHLGIVIQEGEHHPAEDAQAAMALFKKFRLQWVAGTTELEDGAGNTSRKRARRASAADTSAKSGPETGGAARQEGISRGAESSKQRWMRKKRGV